LSLDFAAPSNPGAKKRIGEIAIDSGKLVIADQADMDEHGTEVGPDRIGVIPRAQDDRVLRMLTKRFNLKTVRVNPARAEVSGPVSESLAKEIEDYLKLDPEYSKFPFMYFYIQTNNTFERANFMESAWGFLPIGIADAPLMFVCETGRGDGLYDVDCEFSGDVPCRLSITFIEN
jgi:hypothetical protein